MDTSAQSDQELVVLALKDRHAFATIVERYEAPLLRYTLRLGADQESAKDILQESFIKVYINLNDYDTSLSFSAWLYRIVHNETINHFRKQRIRPAPVEKEEDLLLFDTIPDELSIADESDKKFTRVAVQRALLAIEPQYRDVLVLRFFEEKSYDEISDILKIPTGTVATYISRGKIKLKEQLKEVVSPDV